MAGKKINPILTGNIRGAFVGPLMINLVSAVLQPLAWPLILIVSSLFCFWVWSMKPKPKPVTVYDAKGGEVNPTAPPRIQMPGQEHAQSSAPMPPAPEAYFNVPLKLRKTMLLAGVFFLLTSLITGILACQRGESMSQPAVDWIADRFDQLDEGQSQIQQNQQQQLAAVTSLEARVLKISDALLKKAKPIDGIGDTLAGEGAREDLHAALLRYAQASEASGQDVQVLLDQILEGDTDKLLVFLENEIEDKRSDLYTLYRERFIAAYAIGSDAKSLASARIAAALNPANAQDQWLYGSLLMRQGDLDLALYVLRDALHLYQENEGNNSANIPEVHLNIGYTLALMKRPAEALGAFRDAEAAARRIPRTDPYILVSSQRHMGMMHAAQKEYIDALGAYRAAEKNLRDNYTEDKISLAKVLAGLGSVHEQMNAYPKALAVYREAEELLRAHHGDAHEDVADIVADIAYVYESMDQYMASLKQYREAEQIYRGIHGNTHPDVADTLFKIGYVLGWIDDNDGSLAAFIEAEEIWQKSLPHDHEDLVAVRKKIASTEQKLKDK